MWKFLALLGFFANTFHADACEAVTDVIYDSSSPDYKKTIASSAAECCQICETDGAEYGCTGYTWHSKKTVTKASASSHLCYLHTGTPGKPKKQTGSISGRMSRIPPGKAGKGCATPNATSQTYCNMSLPFRRRAEFLAQELTMDECALRLHSNSPSEAIPRIGLPLQNYRVEAVHGLEAYCMKVNGTYYCPTYFPITQGVVATFNRSVFQNFGSVVGRESRIWTNLGGHAKGFKPMGLSVRVPIINILRDPRWGRSAESVSEDPLLTAVFGETAIRSLQQKDEAGYLLAAGEVKHFAVYNTETGGIARDGRKKFDAVTPKFDLMDTYLPAFKATMSSDGAAARGVMCAYNAVNGEPSCASDFLNRTAREHWGFAGFVESDCDSVGDLIDQFKIAPDKATASAMSINNITDIDCGSTYSALPEAVKRGLTSKTIVRRAVSRAMLPLFEAGLFDGNRSSWGSLGVADLAEHPAQAQDAAAQSLVLLKNDRRMLPVPHGRKIAVLGPQAFNRAELFGPTTIGPCTVGPTEGLLGGGYKENYDCVPNLHEAVQKAGLASEVLAEMGCNLTDHRQEDIDRAAKAAQDADFVILALGTGLSTVDETEDLKSIRLSEGQELLVKAVSALKKPMVVVLVMGNAMGIDTWVDDVPAVLHAFTPSGMWAADTIVKALFGVGPARFGKLPYTMYPANYTSQVSVDDPSLTKGVGRTYRYYSGKAVFPFGYGLSTTSFSIAHPTPTAISFSSQADTATVETQVHNIGDFSGDEVLMLYLRPVHVSIDAPLPRRQLLDFVRVAIPKGGSSAIRFAVHCSQLSLVDNEGRRLLVPGDYELLLSNGLQELPVPLHLLLKDPVVIDSLVDAGSSFGGKIDAFLV